MMTGIAQQLLQERRQQRRVTNIITPTAKMKQHAGVKLRSLNRPRAQERMLAREHVHEEEYGGERGDHAFDDDLASTKTSRAASPRSSMSWKPPTAI